MGDSSRVIIVIPVRCLLDQFLAILSAMVGGDVSAYGVHITRSWSDALFFFSV